MISIEPAPMLEDKEKWYDVGFLIIFFACFSCICCYTFSVKLDSTLSFPPFCLSPPPFRCVCVIAYTCGLGEKHEPFLVVIL